MRKLTALRQHLLNAVPDLRQNPDKLLTFANDGSVKFHRGQNLSHQYTLDAQIIITDYSGTLDAVMVPMLQWINHYQPDLNPDDGIKIEAEILANDRWDLAITVELTERVVALVNCETGRIESEHRMPEYPVDACPAKNWQLYIKDPEDDAYHLEAEWGEE